MVVPFGYFFNFSLRLLFVDSSAIAVIWVITSINK